MKKLCIFPILTFFIVACNSQVQEYSLGRKLRLTKQNDTSFVLTHIVNDSLVDSFKFNYKVLKFSFCYLDEDSVPEVLVMVNKKTRFWPQYDNRLFVYKLYDGRLIRPLWLGSKLCGELLDFSVKNDTFPNLIITDCIFNNKREKMKFSLGGFGLKYCGKESYE
ncbi:MAG: hypothetical protein IKR41_00875 [Bacteroidales bacterium]|nr:hypothetical protein [Bacteroidales bacterium]